MGMCCFKSETERSLSENRYLQYEEIFLKSNTKTKGVADIHKSFTSDGKSLAKMRNHSLDESKGVRSTRNTFMKTKSSLVLLEFFSILERIKDNNRMIFIGDFKKFPKSHFYRVTMVIHSDERINEFDVSFGDFQFKDPLHC